MVRWRACEQHDQPDEFVVTSPEQQVLDQALVALKDAIGGSPQLLTITPMDEVDLGAAAARSTTPVDAQQLPGLIQASPCGGKGLHRPYYLHVTPEGGVRSCLYGPSGEWLGHLGRQSIREILNAAAINPVCQLFEQEAYEPFVERWLQPWQHLSRAALPLVLPVLSWRSWLERFFLWWASMRSQSRALCK